MAFSFGFAGADIDGMTDVDWPGYSAAGNGGQNVQAGTATSAVPVREHALEQLLSTLPDRINYATVSIESPTGRTLLLPRRELYDVRIQLMAEDSSGNEETLNDLDKSDIRAGVYEGGFKTWECSLDLASLLLDRGPRKDIDELVRCDQVIELGAGTALPTLVLFQHAVQNAIPLTFTLQDYNDSVLRLVTLPNLLLQWAAHTHLPNIINLDLRANPTGDLDITPTLKSHFLSDLHSKFIHLCFISGPWSPSVANLIPASAPDMGTLVLGAETIYSPASTTTFVELLVELLKREKMSKAMIGAKRMYFGVGGSVDGLKEACGAKGAVAYEIENHGVPGMEEGVGRALVEVQMY